MKYYSEKLNQLFDTEEALYKAENKNSLKEKEELEKKQQRKDRAKEVEDAFVEVNKAQTNANNLLAKFIKDYGSYHTTLKKTKPLNDLFDFMLNW